MSAISGMWHGKGRNLNVLQAEWLWSYMERKILIWSWSTRTPSTPLVEGSDQRIDFELAAVACLHGLTPPISLMNSTWRCTLTFVSISDHPLLHHWSSVARAFPLSMTGHFRLLPLVPWTDYFGIHITSRHSTSKDVFSLSFCITIKRLRVSCHLDTST